MIQVVKRALSVLNEIATTPETERGLGDIASAVSLNAATCARILRTLVDEGYVEQVGPKKGYILGPVAYGLPARGTYRRDVRLAAEPLVIDLAQDVQESIVLATLSTGRWVPLVEVDCEQSIQVRPEYVSEHDTPYTTATGRLCLAFLSDAERAVVWARCGQPTPDVWPGTGGESRVSAMLAQIRTERFATRESESVIAVAVPVTQDGKVVAGLGSHLPKFRYQGAHKERLLAGLQRTADAINQAISMPSPVPA